MKAKGSGRSHISQQVPLRGGEQVIEVIEPAVSVSRGFDHDLAGRLVRETQGGINGGVYALETEYWSDGSVKRKHLADGT